MPPFIQNLIYALRRVNPWVLLAVSGLIFYFAVLPAIRRASHTFDNRVHVDPKDKRSPQYPYRMDEIGLLQIASEDIQNLEKEKQYGEIYDRFGSKDFKRTIERRDFLKMSNCAETHLGGIQEFDRLNLGFQREYEGNDKNRPIEVLSRRVRRSRGEIFEQLVFVGTGVDFKLNGLYWVTTNDRFLECVAKVAKEAAARPKPQPRPEQPQADPQGNAADANGTPATNQPDANGAPASTSANRPDARTKSTGKTHQSGITLDPKTGEVVKTSDLKKKPATATPANKPSTGGTDTPATAKPLSGGVTRQVRTGESTPKKELPKELPTSIAPTGMPAAPSEPERSPIAPGMDD